MAAAAAVYNFMDMDTNNIVAIILGVLAIIGTYWFFFMKGKRGSIVAGDTANIRVEGGYSPETITIRKGKTTTLRFTRTDPTSCLEEIILPDFRVRKQLPLNETVSIEITPQKTGAFPYSCGMNMYHGTIIVE